MLLGGHARNITLFAAIEMIIVLTIAILQPVTAAVQARISTQAPSASQGEWIYADIDIDTIEMDW